MNKELMEMLNNMIVEESWEKCNNIVKSLYTTLYINNIRYCNNENITEDLLEEFLKGLYNKGYLIDVDVTWNEFKCFMTKDIENYMN
jgi:hypothetical protein